MDNENRIPREKTPDKFYYTWSMYSEDIEKIKELYKDKHIDGIISIYRGSLGIGAHLSNIFDKPLSIIKLQMIDGNKELTFPLSVGDFKSGENYVIVDDIYDSGETMKTVLKYFKKNFEANFEAVCLIGDNNSVAQTLNLHPKKWIVFPWEI